ncbi:uncharacterized protein isoform X2 [Choristoneura fumiferana]
MCHLCQLSMPGPANYLHEISLHHQAAKQIAAVALDRWIAHMTADSVTVVQDPDAVDNATFCDICTEAVPSAAYSKHLTSRPHLISALDVQVFEELVREYVDVEDLKFLESPTVGDGTVGKSDAKTTYKCHICALQVPSPFKSEHEHSIHHRTRVALATTAARRTSAFLHNQTPIGVQFKGNIKMTELLKSYIGTDLWKRPVEEKEDVIEKEVEEKTSQVEIKKRLTAKQYFTDILPYLQYTEALYTIIVDDTEYVTIKNTNGTCMRVHVANFNGIYSDSGDVHYNLKCKMCHGYNQYMTYSSEKDHDKLHVMCLGHIRQVLTPIDNVHGIRKLGNGHALCVVCNAYMHENAIENHIFNAIHHTAALAEALKLGRNFKESKNDLKIIIYTSQPVEKTNYVTNHVRNFPHNNVSFGGGLSFPQGGQGNLVMPEGGSISKPQFSVFGVQGQSATFGNTASTGKTFGSGPANTGFGAGTASAGTFGSAPASRGTFGSAPASTGTTFGSAPASRGTFGSAPASTGTTFGSAPASTGTIFGSAPASTGTTFGCAPASTGTTFGSAPASTGTIFGSAPASTGTTFGCAPASTGTTFGSSPASMGKTFGSGSPSTGFVSVFTNSAKTLPFGAPATASNGTGAGTANSLSYGIKPASISIFGASPASNDSASTDTGKPAANNAFGASTTSTGGLFSASNTTFGANAINNDTLGADTTSNKDDSPVNLKSTTENTANPRSIFGGTPN